MKEMVTFYFGWVTIGSWSLRYWMKLRFKGNFNLPLNMLYIPMPGWQIHREMKSESEVAQLCPTLCDPVNCSPPGSSVHGILQARILEWVAKSAIYSNCFKIRNHPYTYTFFHGGRGNKFQSSSGT